MHIATMSLKSDVWPRIAIPSETVFWIRLLQSKHSRLILHHTAPVAERDKNSQLTQLLHQIQLVIYGIAFF